MKEVVIRETDIVSAANEGMDSFLSLFVKSIKDSVGGELNAENMVELNVNQITLLAYDILHEKTGTSAHYTMEEMSKLSAHIADATSQIPDPARQEIRNIMLRIYAGPLN